MSKTITIITIEISTRVEGLTYSISLHMTNFIIYKISTSKFMSYFFRWFNQLYLFGFITFLKLIHLLNFLGNFCRPDWFNPILIILLRFMVLNNQIWFLPNFSFLFQFLFSKISNTCLIIIIFLKKQLFINYLTGIKFF